MAAAPVRVNDMAVGVEGARPYGAGGNVPANAVVTAIKPHGRGVLYVSDVPFEQPYNERPECSGTRTNGERCKAKSEAGAAFCKAHEDQG